MNRDAPFRHCAAGALPPLERKSVEPTTASVDPGRVRAAHQSLNHFVAKADRSDRALLAEVFPLIGRDGLELKQELGLGRYEGCGWRGFHHHASSCIAGDLVRDCPDDHAANGLPA